MKEDIKMSSAFSLPLGVDGFSSDLVDSGGYVINETGLFEIAHAINNHDRLVDENEEQAKQIQMLRDALIDAREHQWCGLAHNGRDKTHPKWVSGCKALKETEGGK